MNPELDPENDTKTDKWNLDIEAANISNVLNAYDDVWNEAIGRLEKLNAQIENIQDELKNSRLTLSFKAKSEWKNIPEFNEGKSPSDKLCESWAVGQPEYQEKFNILKTLREDRAIAIATEALFKNYHYQLLNKSGKIDTLTKQWAAQYFTTDKNIETGENNQTDKKSVNAVAEMTDMLNKPRRKLKQ